MGVLGLRGVNGLAAGFSVNVFFGGALAVPSPFVPPVPLPLSTAELFWLCGPPPDWLVTRELLLLLVDVFMCWLLTDDTLLLLCTDETPCGGEFAADC